MQNQQPFCEDKAEQAADIADPNGPTVPVQSISATARCATAITVAAGGMVFMLAGCIYTRTPGVIQTSNVEWERQQAAEERLEHGLPSEDATHDDAEKRP